MKLKEFISNFFTKGEARTIKVKKNIFISFVLKGLSILISFLLVPLTLEYLNPTKYGIWLTLSSIIGWLSFFDVGLGNGLRNKLTEAFAIKDFKLAKSYVSSTYAIITIIMTVVYVLFLIIMPNLSWGAIFNVSEEIASELNTVIIIVFTFFALRFILKIIGIIFTADQSPAFNNLFDFIGSLLSLISIAIITKFSKGSLLYISIAYSITPVFTLIIASLYFFKVKYRAIRPSFRTIDLNNFKNLARLGVNFFVLQIAVLIIFTTDNMIITQVLGPTEVTPYNIAFKYFSLPIMICSIIMTPFWSAFTDAYTINDLLWVKKSMKRLIQIWLLVVIMIITLFLISGYFYNFWIGDKVEIPITLSLFMALFAIISTWNNIFASFLNGASKIKLQMYSSVIAMSINIPLSIFFAKHLELGSAGVILGTCVTLIFGAVLGPLQAYLILENRASGIWNK
jgi:O-antigen/teichoic acid export membrane protein